MAKARNNRSAGNTQKPAEKPAAQSTPKVDWSTMFVIAVYLFLTDGFDVAALQARYRDIPAGARTAKLPLAGFKAAGEHMFAVMDAIDNLPASTPSTKAGLSDDSKAAILTAAVLSIVLARLNVIDPVLSGLVDAGRAIDADAFASTLAKVQKSVSDISVGNDRKTVVSPTSGKPVTLSTLVSAGIIPAGTVLTGPNDAKATVQADGKVQFGNESLSLSAAAGKAAKHSQNGWDFWRMDGDLIGPKRAIIV
jgi:hypothetical protein